jgi:hypothetical protein
LRARVILAHLAPFFRRHANPLAHAFLYAYLLVRLHLGVTVGDAQPLLLAHSVHLVPLASERLQRLLLGRREIFPQDFSGALAAFLPWMAATGAFTSSGASG